MTQKISDSVCFPLVPLMKPSVQMEVMRLVITRKRGTVREVWYSDKYVFQVTDLESEELAQAALSADKREKYHGEAIGYYNGESMTDPEVIPDSPS